HDQPAFMTALKENRTIFVQLKRENLADQIISYVIAMNTGAWHSRVITQDVPDGLREKPLDARLIKQLCKLFSEAESLTEDLLRDYPYRITLSYERAFTNGALSSEATGLLGATIGKEIRAVALPMRPNAVV